MGGGQVQEVIENRGPSMVSVLIVHIVVGVMITVRHLNEMRMWLHPTPIVQVSILSLPMDSRVTTISLATIVAFVFRK